MQSNSATRCDEAQQSINLLGSLYPVPEAYEISQVRNVAIDRRPICWLRFERSDGRNRGLYGEYFSIIIDPYDKKIMGFTFLDEELIEDTAPDEISSERIALQFIREHAPDIADSIEVRWIQPLTSESKNPPHDSALSYTDKRSSISRNVLGTRVKMLDKNTGLYAWVVITKSGEIINFERDVHWSVRRGRRTTEVWLHDSYPIHPGRALLPTESEKALLQLNQGDRHKKESHIK